MPSLSDLLHQQDELERITDAGYAEYIRDIPAGIWDGWWGLWLHHGKYYHAVRFEQNGQEVAATWYDEGVRHGFSGTLTDSGLRLVGLRCATMEDDRFVSPLSMTITPDGASITLNWNWHVLFPNGTEPRQICRAKPEVFLLQFPDCTLDVKTEVLHLLHKALPNIYVAVASVCHEDGWGGDIVLGEAGTEVIDRVLREAEEAVGEENGEGEGGEVPITAAELGSLHIPIPKAWLYQVVPHPELKFPSAAASYVTYKDPYEAFAALLLAGIPSIWIASDEVLNSLNKANVLVKMLQVASVEKGAEGGLMEGIEALRALVLE